MFNVTEYKDGKDTDTGYGHQVESRAIQQAHHLAELYTRKLLKDGKRAYTRLEVWDGGEVRISVISNEIIYHKFLVVKQ